MNTNEPIISQAAKDTILACYAAGDNLPVTETLVDLQADIVQRFITQETAALQAQLDDFIERRKEDLAVVASQQTRLDAARAEIVTLREALEYVFWMYEPGRSFAKPQAVLARTAKDYEGLVVVPKAEWEEVNADRNHFNEQWAGKSIYANNLEQERANLRADLAAQSAKLSEAEKDTRRLDWLEQNVSSKNPRFAHDVYATWDADKTFRAALDAAIAKGGSA